MRISITMDGHTETHDVPTEWADRYKAAVDILLDAWMASEVRKATIKRLGGLAAPSP